MASQEIQDGDEVFFADHRTFSEVTQGFTLAKVRVVRQVKVGRMAMAIVEVLEVLEGHWEQGKQYREDVSKFVSAEGLSQRLLGLMKKRQEWHWIHRAQCQGSIDSHRKETRRLEDELCRIDAWEQADAVGWGEILSKYRQ